MPVDHQDKIAIIGVSIELPSGEAYDKNLDHKAFFDFLLNGKEAYETIPADRFNIKSWKGNAAGRISAEKGAFMKGLDLFDNLEFGLSVKDATIMAPGTRKLIENTFLALKDSGINYRARNIGCFCSGVTYDITDVTEPDEFDATGSFAGYASMVSNRVSQHLDLLGPSIPTDTACSSSGTALHVAVNSLICGDCEAAVVGGSQIDLHFMDWVNYAQGSILAKDGKCKPFDASADGFARAEGTAVVVVKRYEDAVRDKDHIYATILGSGVSVNGAFAAPGAPVAETQKLAMRAAFKRAGITPQDVDYVECHATGTAKGDPVEANWIGEVFQRDSELLIGSVKGNIGHTEITSFLVSMSKVLSAFEHQTIPQNVNLTTPNPRIRWNDFKLKVPLEPTPLPSKSGKSSIVAMASSGIGGANVHAILEGPPIQGPTSVVAEKPSSGLTLLTAAGLSPRTIAACIDSLKAEVIPQAKDRQALSVVLGRQARQMTWRSFAVVHDDDDTSQVKFPQGVLVPRHANPFVFVLSGQGPQYNNMGRQLFDAFPAFRNSILECDEAYTRMTGKSIVNDIGLFGSKPADVPDQWPIALTLPSLAIFQIAMYDLLVSLGIRPSAVVGHSAGETSALYVSGAGPKAMAVELGVARGIAFAYMESLSGTMAALSCGAAEAQGILDQVNADSSIPAAHTVDIACYNAPGAVAIAGPMNKIDKIIDIAAERKIRGLKIRTRVPVHSSMMEECQDLYRKVTGEVFARYPGPHKPKIPVYSTCTGDLFDGEYTDEYYWINTRNPVEFVKALKAMKRDFEDMSFIEISPHPVLSSYIAETLSASHPVFPTARRPGKDKVTVEHRTFLQMVGSVLNAGYNEIDFSALNNRSDSIPTSSIPSVEYPFLRKSFPLYPNVRSTRKQRDARNGPLNSEYLRLNTRTHPSLADHVVRGEAIMPAAGFIESAFEYKAPVLIEVNLRALMSLTPEVPLHIDTSRDGSYWSVSSVQYDKAGQSVKKLHADGYLSFEKPPTPSKLDLASIKARCNKFVMDSSKWYSSIKDVYPYGTYFQRVEEFSAGKDEALLKIKGFDDALRRDDPYVLHPAILDACFQTCCLKAFTGDLDPNAYYLPARFGRVVLYYEGELPSEIYAHAVLNTWTPHSISYDITAVDAQGNPLFSVEEYRADRHRINPILDATHSFDLIYQPILPPVISAALTEKSFKASEPTDALNEIVHVLDKTLSQVEADASRKVFNLFLAGDVHLIRDQLAAVLSQHESLYVTYVMIPSEPSGPLDVPETRATGQVGSLAADVPWEEQGIQAGYFDAAVLVNSVMNKESQQILPEVRRLLVPEGRLLVLDKKTAEVSETGTKDLTSELAQTFFKTLAQVSLPGEEESVYLEASRDNGTDGALFDADPDVLAEYTAGSAMDLQWFLSGIEMSLSLPVWLIAKSGVDADELIGIVRVIRKEYPRWDIKAVAYPPTWSRTDVENALSNLPRSLMGEAELILTDKGQVLVPRLAMIPAPAEPRKSSVPKTTLNASSATEIAVQSAVSINGVVAFVGQKDGQTVLGLGPDDIVSGPAIVDASSLYFCPENLKVSWKDALHLLPGLVTSALAPSLSLFLQPKQLKASKVLVTHAASEVGKIVLSFYTALGLDVVAFEEEQSPLTLARLGINTFDLVVSGYQDNGANRVLDLLVKQGGHLFTYSSCETSLESLARNEPATVGYALRVAFEKMEENGIAVEHILPQYRQLNGFVPSPRRATIFRPDKSYLLLGGLGSLGPHIVNWMYENGARHVTIAARTVYDSPKGPVQVYPFRLLDYLKAKCWDLDLKVVKLDAADKAAMKQCIDSLTPELDGCFCLTAANIDGVFSNMTEDEFTQVYKATVDVMSAFIEAVGDVEKLDHLVMFSTVSALFGNAGQSNYSAAKAVTDGMINKFKNTFSYICPPIAGTQLVTKGDKQLLLSAQVSVQQMLKWLEEGLVQLQDGRSMSLYVPAFDWEEMNRTFEIPRLAAPLLPLKGASNGDSGADPTEALVNVVLGHVDVAREDLDHDVPLTSYGLDSLSASRLSMSLQKAVGINVTQFQLLANMTTDDLAGQLKEKNADAGSDELDAATLEKNKAGMREMLEKFTIRETRTRDASLPTPEKKTILITGTTAGLGCNILHQALKDPAVERVYALNRKSKVPSVDRQAKGLSEEGLPAEDAKSPKLTLVEVEYGAPQLGLSKETLDSLKSVTHIIHNAWQTDFVQGITAFEGLVQGTRDLIDIASNSTVTAKPGFSLVSTIATARIKNNKTPTAEAPITPEEMEAFVGYPMPGYIQSKWVAEQLAEQAAKKLGLTTNVIRVGQLTGGISGAWNTAQWMPALVKSALFLKSLPSGDDSAPWIPVDVAASAVLDLYGQPGFFHVVHPKPVSWSTILSLAAQAMNVPTIPYDDWLKRLETTPEDEGKGNPAVKMLDFFRLQRRDTRFEEQTDSMGLLAKVEVSNAVAHSKTLGDPMLPQLGEKDVNNWIGYWKQVGYLTIE